ncbi:peptide-methionine (R)-S-oxide reductase MsrB [Spirosoma sp. RP8]|uniref:peptide-methionine (R)-S-oxide reductase n=1 Tax=Spirosoma liriopis TaxID=2937440 RepID=A0ABT0HQE5_9BACT|nr:peptide-methionine (R)-S-oxide reductase MsrB [Spirosoma liriopis]MCK8494404.1 peptide-methionine (R)-S-oxide reductase MsrB [Spirosoma liriopis]
MKHNKLFLLVALLTAGSLWLYGRFLATPRPQRKPPVGTTSPDGRRVEKSDAEWRSILSNAQYDVTRERGTEWPNSSELTYEHRPGIYRCVCCHNPLFSSLTKFDSRTGWPSFYAPIVQNALYTEPDGGRTEVRCAVCDAHLGHVFNDGPDPTGLRYCMNGVALVFTQADMKRAARNEAAKK